MEQPIPAEAKPAATTATAGTETAIAASGAEAIKPGQEAKNPETPQAPAAERVNEAMTQAHIEATSAANLDRLLTAFNVPIDKLPEDLKTRRLALVRGKNERNEPLTAKQYKTQAEDFLAEVKAKSTEMGIDQESVQLLTNLQGLIQVGKISQTEVFNMFKGHVEASDLYSETEKAEARQRIDTLTQEYNKEQDKQNPQAIQETQMGLMKLSKILGAVILALLGFGVWRGFKEMTPAPQGQ